MTRPVAAGSSNPSSNLRVPLRLNGRFMRTDHREFPCILADISSSGAAVNTEVAVTNGERIVAVVDKLGTLVGRVVRIFPPGFGPGGFAMLFEATPNKQAKLAALIEELSRTEPQQAPLPPVAKPSPSPAATAIIKLASGETFEARVLDMSFAGASLATAARPPVGSRIELGKLPARVARHTANGIIVALEEAGLTEIMRLERRNYFVKPANGNDWTS